MTIWEGLLLGLLQGLAEFLPISSSGHLALLRLLFGLEQQENMMFFDICLHIATLAAVFIVFRRDIAELLAAFGSLFNREKRKRLSGDARLRLILLILAGTVPLFVIVLFKDMIEGFMEKPVVIGLAMLATGVVLKLTENIKPGKKNGKTATVTDALVVGVMQAVATLPGLSRSGMTISTGLFRKFDRSFAFRFSFLLSIPAILGAAVLDIGKVVEEGFKPAMIAPTLAGMAVAAVVGFIALKLVQKLLVSNHFSKFAWYCLGIGAVTIISSILLQA